MSTKGGGSDWSAIMDAHDKDAGSGLESDRASHPATKEPVNGNMKKSWASILGGSLPVRDDKNVLEVVLEKDSRGSFIVTEDECFHMMKKLGLDIRPGVHVEEVQICPQGRNVIFITLKKEIEITRFCRYEVLEITKTGIRAVMVKPAVKREVVVTAKGIHPNTRDAVVLDYLTKFGKVSTNKVVYGVYPEGPLKGFKNGDRSYQLEIKPGTNLGSYHYIDSQKITVKYPGQQQTCARCYQTPRNCRGKGMAKKCEAEGGVRVEFTDHILDLWKTIGYSPDKLGDVQNSESEDSVSQQTGGIFTPKKGPVLDTDKFTGVSIKSFPKDTDHGEIVEFLVKCGLPEMKRNCVNFNTNGKVIIKDLDNSDCLNLVEVIHGKKHFGQKMFCNGYIPLTPEKVEFPEPDADSHGHDPSGKPLPPFQPEKPLPPQVNTNDVLQPHLQVHVHEQQNFSSQPADFFNLPSNNDVARRYSLSLDRSPPPNSLAADILGKSQNFSLGAAQSLLSQIADMKDSLSDFNSCAEEFSDSSSNSNDCDRDLEEDYMYKVKNTTAKERKREKRRKRKLSQTPDKDFFLVKKPNIGASPQ